MTLVADPCRVLVPVQPHGYLQVHQFVRHRCEVLAANSVNYENVTGAGVAQIKAGDKGHPFVFVQGWLQMRPKDAAFKKDVVSAIKAAGLPSQG